MTENETNIASIQLQTSAELFAEPEADPFNPQSRYLSGIDEIANQLRWAPRSNPYRIIIALPEAELTVENQTRTREALQRYCAYQIASNQYELSSLRIEARRSMALSILYALMFILIGILIGFLPVIPQAIKAMLASLLGIFTWAALWPAADVYLFAWKPFRRAERLYKNLSQAELIFERL